jgi:hypothetical protein
MNDDNNDDGELNLVVFVVFFFFSDIMASLEKKGHFEQLLCAWCIIMVTFSVSV